MKAILTVGGFAAVLLAGTGCRSHTAGRCDCTNHPESAVITAPAANYPVMGGSSVSNASPSYGSTTLAPNGMTMGSSAPAPMPSTMPSVPAPMPK